MAPILTTGAGAYRIAASAYVGPGDIFAFGAWYGLRGYSAAYSTGSNPAIDIVDQAGANTLTVNILSNGNLDLASINTWVTAHTVTTIKVTKIYDQAGTNHAIQATLANMPVLSLTAIGSLPGMVFSGTGVSGQSLLSGSSFPGSQPYTISAAYKRTGNTGNISPVLVSNSFLTGLFANSSANTITIYGGTAQSVTATDNIFYAVQGLINGASSSIYFNGTLSGTLSVGTNGISAVLAIGTDNSGVRFINGVILETGVVAANQSANNSAVNLNQRAYWGF